MLLLSRTMELMTFRQMARGSSADATENTALLLYCPLASPDAGFKISNTAQYPKHLSTDANVGKLGYGRLEGVLSWSEHWSTISERLVEIRRATHDDYTVNGLSRLRESVHPISKER